MTEDDMKLPRTPIIFPSDVKNLMSRINHLYETDDPFRKLARGGRDYMMMWLRYIEIVDEFPIEEADFRQTWIAWRGRGLKVTAVTWFERALRKAVDEYDWPKPEVADLGVGDWQNALGYPDGGGQVHFEVDLE